MKLGGLWFLAVLLALSTVFSWIVPLEREIGAANEQSHAAWQRAVSDEHALHDMPRIQALVRRMHATLAGVRLRATSSESSEALLRDIAQLASRDGLAVTAIKPSSALSASPPPFIASPSSPLMGARYDDFEISVRGAYRDIVDFLRDLSHMSTLTRVMSLQVERSEGNAPADPPALDALIHVQTIRFDSAKSLEEHTPCLFPCAARLRSAAPLSSRSAS